MVENEIKRGDCGWAAAGGGYWAGGGLKVTRFGQGGLILPVGDYADAGLHRHGNKHERQTIFRLLRWRFGAMIGALTNGRRPAPDTFWRGTGARD